jgi:hypothetical protein
MVNRMDPTLLAAVATLVTSLPAILDEEVKAKVVNPKVVAAATMGIGVVAAGVNLLLTKVAAGVSWSAAGTAAGAAIVVGVAAGIRNLYATSSPTDAANMAAKRAALTSVPPPPPAA